MTMIRTARFLTVFLIGVLAAMPRVQAQSSDQAGVMLQAAIQTELVDGDLGEAIELYNDILARFGNERPVAAKALLHLGRCYEKLGEAKAREAYERLLREYADQSQVTAQARTRLAALRQPATAEASGVVIRQVWTRTVTAVSPDGRYLIFQDSDELAVRDVRSGENRSLTPGSHRRSGYPAISPDGQRVAYLSWNNEGSELHIVGLDGSRPQVLVSNEEVPWLQPFAWSPDGKQILAVFERKDATNQIVFVSTADGSARVLKSLEGRYPRKMSLSPDGRYIAYDSRPQQDSRERDIFVLSTDGSLESVLVEHPANDEFPIWTPDGKRILFTSDRTGTMDQWVIRVAEGKPQGSPLLVKQGVPGTRPIGFTPNGNYYYNQRTGLLDVYIATLDPTTGKVVGPPTLASERYRGGNTLPEWSADGQYLAYLSFFRALRPNVIVIQSLETGEERELSPELAFFRDTRLRWSPDGRSFLVSGRDNNRREGLYQIDAQTGDVTPIAVSRTKPVPVSQRNMWHAAWSLDGKAIFYVHHTDDESCEILVRDMQTGREMQLYRPDARTHLSDLALSTDGQRLAFASSTKRSHVAAEALLVMPAAGGTPRELLRLPQETAGRFTYSIAWTRDGSQLLFSRRVGEPSRPSELWRISAQGGEPERLGLPLWGRGGVRVHPDGRRIAFSYPERKSGLWVIENFLSQLEGNK
ncbi:MAG: PD40 domain-containing protein [Acidobacteria bacterium]|nr:PD40 domain-containing protein [Acidobacteriota bacterium]